jgi:hypothetical protein
MSQASILHAHAAESQFATSSRTSDKTQRNASMAASSPERSRNYLPGLRPVTNDLEAYFKDEFVWLIC